MDRTEEKIILAVCQQLKEEEFAYTVEFSGVMWDVYYHETHGRDVTIAFCMKDGKAVIGVFSAGRLGEEEVRRKLYVQ